jgi:hypothetical protein
MDFSRASTCSLGVSPGLRFTLAVESGGAFVPSLLFPSRIPCYVKLSVWTRRPAMKKLVAYALATGGILSTSTAAVAQTPFGHAFCGIYQQVLENGAKAFVDLRGSPLPDGRWEAKDISVPGGRCFIRSAAGNADMLACSVVQQSIEDAKLWATDMSAASRNCLNELAGFAERDDSNEKDGAKVARTIWIRQTSNGALRISIATIIRSDGKATNRMQINLNKKE